MSEKYICPVCGFDQMEDAPANDEICGCCLTHFGYDDCQTKHEVLRQRWIDSGCVFHVEEEMPEHWDGYAQLRNINVYVCELCDKPIGDDYDICPRCVNVLRDSMKSPITKVIHEPIETTTF